MSELIGFCGCNGGRRENIMLDESEFDNPKVRCLSCDRTYQAVRVVA